ncbi:MAG: hypothetical protein JEY99_06100 [Spirochaetales bacterium]|nr:hypothetical protein [Spirochaetales bacterium]
MKANLKKKILFCFLVIIFGLFKLYSQPSLPFSFNLAIHPDPEGSQTEAGIYWHRSEMDSSLLFSYQTADESGDLPEFGTDSLYSLSTGDGEVILNPFIFSGSLWGFAWKATAGLGVKIESMEERGHYQSGGVQRFINQISSWRLGIPLNGNLSGNFGPVYVNWELTVDPLMFYSLFQHQESSLVPVDGELHSMSLISPEIDQSIRISLFSLAWVSVYHQFLGLSVPRLTVNDAGDGWMSVVESYNNQNFRILAGGILNIPGGQLEAGLGWKRSSSTPEGGAAVINDGLVFELNISAGTGRSK